MALATDRRPVTPYPTSPSDPTRPPAYGQSGQYGPPPGQYGQQPYGQPGQYGPPPGQNEPPPGYGRPQYGQAGQYGPPPGQHGPPPGYGQQPPHGYGPPRPAWVPPELLADWGKRVLASLVDAAPIVGFIIVVNVLGAAVGDLGFILALSGLLWVGILGYAIWQLYQQGTTGQTIGKKFIGIKLVAIQTGQPIGFGPAFVRALAHILDGLPFYIGYLWPLWDDQKQTFADKVCSTVVIKV
jgi:uncharacterized RDD family membrane protein YckC